MKEQNYGLVGSGLLANHFLRLFQLENIQLTVWNRRDDTLLPEEKLSECDIILLAISDGAIEEFSSSHKFKKSTLIHFSGALEIKGVTGFHPLMTFSQELYTLDKYRKIPFVGTEDITIFREIFPWLRNSYFQIPVDKKPLYHALCVIGGNFTTILWQKVIKDFKEELNIPEHILNPYIDQICHNIKEDYKTALTGPVKRQDKLTIRKNIKALQSRLWKRIYRLFNRVYLKELK